MAKNLKINIKNTQIAEAINLSGLKGKLAKKKEEETEKKASTAKPTPRNVKTEGEELPKEEAPRIRARSKSAFAEPVAESLTTKESSESTMGQIPEAEEKNSSRGGTQNWLQEEEPVRVKTSAELRQEIFGEEPSSPAPANKSSLKEHESMVSEPLPAPKPPVFTTPPPTHLREEGAGTKEAPLPFSEKREISPEKAASTKLGPTGKHIKDYLKPKPVVSAPRSSSPAPSSAPAASKESAEAGKEKQKTKFVKAKPFEKDDLKTLEEEKNAGKASKFKEFRDVKPARRQETKQFDARDRQGLRTSDDDQQWRRRRGKPQRAQIQEDLTVRPTSLKIRLPISIKDLASEMKLKASQLISKLFLQGLVVTLNDLLEDETTIQLLGHEFGCEIAIDTAEEKRIQITDKSIKEELLQTSPEQLQLRPPVVAFMGHVDHGKTSLIDFIRKSNRASGEAGAITQHIGAFLCKTPIGDIAVLDTPGHEAFSAMRARGADVTDIVVLVVAGDEGLRQQTIEAIQHAKAAHVIIVVAINKSDKPNFNPDNVYRQLAEQDLLPEVWGGQTITVNCSAITGQGIPELLEMLALQAEVLELRANPKTRARGTVLESEMHKGMGAVTTVLVQNGTLRRGDALVFGQLWGRVKTMHNEYRQELQEAGPSTPVEITGLSGLPEAGQEFIVVKSEKEAREISEARSEGFRQSHLLLQQKKKTSMESLLQVSSSGSGKKVLNLILRADVQGSLEALKAALLKIQAEKVDLDIVFTGVGEISESDVQLAAASKAVIIGFHTQIESHAEPLIKQLGIQVRLHNIIYHAIDDVKAVMTGLLDKIAQETEKGKALVKATFKSSQAGVIAGCQVIEGTIHRSYHIRVRRGDEIVWKGTMASLKRVKEDVREVQKGLECGILLNNFSDIHQDDILEAYEVTYISQEL